MNPLKEAGKYKTLKTLESRESDSDKKVRSRHNTQPRSHARPFGFASDYAISTKNQNSGAYISPLQPRTKSGNSPKFQNADTVSSLRREYQSEAQKKSSINPTPSKLDPYRGNQSKRNTPGIVGGVSVLSAIPPAKSNIQLQGFTIRPDSKYTSLAEVHQRGFMPKNNFMASHHTRLRK